MELASPLMPKPAPLTTLQKAMRARFFEAAVGEPCAVCGAPATDSHHAVEKQRLKFLGFGPEVIWDLRNAVFLCSLCHHRHTTGSRPLRLAVLSRVNWTFAREWLGAYADDYFKDRYVA